MALLFALHVLCLLSAALVGATGLASSDVSAARARLIASASKSWELGTMMEALLEHDSSLSVFGSSPIPPSPDATLPSAALSALNKALSSRPTGTQTFVHDGSAGDPASLGVTDLIANITVGGANYSSSASDEINFLFNNVPQSADGILSHRTEYFQAWSDFISMVPPFLAYYGAVEGGSQGKSLLLNAYHQISGYRTLLRDPATKLWNHVVDGPWEDVHPWATGNGWAALGMLRVLETMNKSPFRASLGSQRYNLQSWASEIVNATWAMQRPSGSLGNYLDDATSFNDSASTALMAAVTFRLAALTGNDAHIGPATKALQLISNRIDDDGWLTDVVNPYSFGKAGSQSPEAQAFVLMLDAAYKQWDSQNTPAPPPGAINVAPGPTDSPSPVGVTALAEEMIALVNSLAAIARNKVSS